MKNKVFDIVSGIVSGMKNVSIKESNYTDRFFETGFSAKGCFIGFDFFSGADRANYDIVLRALKKKRSLSFTVIKYTGYVAGIQVYAERDSYIISRIESARIQATERFALADHEMRISGFSDSDRIQVLNEIHAENVRAFLSEFQFVKAAA